IGFDLPAGVGDLLDVLDLVRQVVVYAVQGVVDIVVGLAAHVQFRHQLAVFIFRIAAQRIGHLRALLVQLSAVHGIGTGFRNLALGQIRDLRAAGLAAIGRDVALERNRALRITDVAVILHGAIVQVGDVLLNVAQLADVDRVGGIGAGRDIGDLEPTGVDAGAGRDDDIAGAQPVIADEHVAAYTEARGSQGDVVSDLHPAVIEYGVACRNGVDDQVGIQVYLDVIAVLGDDHVAVVVGEVDHFARLDLRLVARRVPVDRQLPSRTRNIFNALELADVDGIGVVHPRRHIDDGAAACVDAAMGDAGAACDSQPAGRQGGIAELDTAVWPQVQVARHLELLAASGSRGTDIRTPAGKRYRQAEFAFQRGARVGRKAQRPIGQFGQLVHIHRVGARLAPGHIGDLVAAHVHRGVATHGELARPDHQRVVAQVGRAAHAQVVGHRHVGHVDLVGQRKLHVRVGRALADHDVAVAGCQVHGG